MEYEMIVYESEASRMKNPADTERFDRSCQALKGVGIEVGRVMCTSTADMSPEAAEIIEAQGMDSLPICMYQGVDITIGEYPSDQDLADFLDAPDGTLSVNKQGPPAMGNDIMPACACGNRPK